MTDTLEGFTFDDFTALIASPGITQENALRCALARDNQLSFDEVLTSHRAKYAHRVHGLTWDELTSKRPR